MAGVLHLEHRGGGQDASPHFGVAQLAASQHGVVARWQLKRGLLTPRQIEGRLRAGHFHPVCRGVYAVGHPRLGLKGRWMAAVLASGPDGVLSHRAAAALWELRGIPAGPIDVTALRHRQGPRWVRVHLVRRLDSQDRRILDGIPVTGLERTLLDYAELHRDRPQAVRLALEAAERRDLLDYRRIEAAIARNPGRRGITPLRRALAEVRGPAPMTLSELENRFLALIRSAGIPEPLANVMVEGYLVDFFWPQERLVVEIDGYRFHKTRGRFSGDRLRDTKLQLANCRVLRATHERIAEGRELVGDVVAMLRLGRRHAGGAAASGR